MSVKNKRTCLKCAAELDYSLYQSKNESVSKEYLLKIWMSDELQFFCCNCIKDQKEINFFVSNIKDIRPFIERYGEQSLKIGKNITCDLLWKYFLKFNGIFTEKFRKMTPLEISYLRNLSNDKYF